jgi:hypothetical protein
VNPFRRERKPSPRQQQLDRQIALADALLSVLTQNGAIEFYDYLTDDEVLDYAEVLWDYHSDLRDEWSRRQMMKAAVGQ